MGDGNGLEWESAGGVDLVLGTRGDDGVFRCTQPVEYAAKQFIGAAWYSRACAKSFAGKSPGPGWHICSAGKLPHSEHPYPNFARRHSVLWHVDPACIEPSWRDAAREHMAYWLRYFTEDPSPVAHVGTLEQYAERWKGLAVEDVQERWGVPVWDGENIDAAVAYLRRRYLDETVAFLEDTIDRLTV